MISGVARRCRGHCALARRQDWLVTAGLPGVVDGGPGIAKVLLSVMTRGVVRTLAWELRLLVREHRLLCFEIPARVVPAPGFPH
jgi:hypothetical protein